MPTVIFFSGVDGDDTAALVAAAAAAALVEGEFGGGIDLLARILPELPPAALPSPWPPPPPPAVPQGSYSLKAPSPAAATPTDFGRRSAAVDEAALEAAEVAAAAAALAGC